MGVPELWQIIKPASSEHDFADYCLKRTMVYETEDDRILIQPLVVGIDASIWMHECQAVFHHRHHAQMGENPELRTLFHRLANLLSTFIIPIFIFDGTKRPSQKRGKKVSDKPHWLTSRFMEFIDAFGFYSHVAKGEAEAEMAHLNKLGFLDAVFTQDSDALVFGAQCVLKQCTTKDKNIVGIYNAEKIRSLPSVSLTEGGLFLFTLLRGGDYSSGLFGCGGAIAHGVAQTGLGDSLLNATRTMTVHELRSYLSIWRNELKFELANNPGGYLKCQYKTLSKRISDEFPDITTLHSYAFPVVSSFTNLDRSQWVSRNINIRSLTRLCEQSFSWGTVTGISTKFINVLWKGVAFRQLLEFAHLGVNDEAIIPPHLFCKARRLPHHAIDTDYQGYSVTVYIQHLTERLPGYIEQLRHESLHDKEALKLLSKTVTMKAPFFLMKYHLSDLFNKKDSRGLANTSMYSNKQKNKMNNTDSDLSKGQTVDSTSKAAIFIDLSEEY